MVEQSLRQLQIGAEAFSRGDYDLATRHFARAVASNSEDFRTHLMLGVAQYWSGKVDEAMAAYREVLRLDPKSAVAHQLIGIAHAWKGDMAAALSEFKEAAQLSPDRPDIQMDLGSVYETMGERALALDCFRRSVALEPNYPLYHYQLGMLYDKLGRDQDAQDSLKEAIRLYPDFQDALLQQGSLKQRSGNLEEAASLFKKAVRLKSGDAVARLRLGLAHLSQGKLEKIADDLDKAFQLTPESDGSRLALSRAYRGGNPSSTPQESDGPLAMFRRNLERIPANQEAKVQAQITRIQKKPITFNIPKEGTSSLKNALERSIAGPSATHTQREFSLPPSSPEERRTQIERILAELRQSLENSPQDGEVHLGMNISYPKRDAESPTNVHPVSYDPRRVGNDLGLWVQGTGWVELVEETVPILNQRLIEHPKDIQALTLLGLAHLTLGDAAEARRMFENALEQAPNDIPALLGLGVAHVIIGEDEAALTAYRKVLALKPKDKTAKDAVKWLTTPISK